MLETIDWVNLPIVPMWTTHLRSYIQDGETLTTGASSGRWVKHVQRPVISMVVV
jgi:hypothetical protein